MDDRKNKRAPAARCEVLAPAGSFPAAIRAFRDGADAVYLGLPRFSARRNALNFTLEEFARLRTAADGMNRKIYVAANTVFREEETEELLSLLYEAALHGADAVIVQDYGLARLVRAYFPDLPLHASTQTAVHNAAGVRALEALGFSRIILSRELGFDEIVKLRKEFPRMEFETFIHGALCYGFSGLCLASGYLLGRSGNRGECAQICRTWFEHRTGKGYFFSTNDLSLEEDVLALRDAGITSFKIEGRMKSPEYAGLATSYYRSVLDGVPGEAGEERLSRLRTEYSRKPTRGFFRNPKGDDLVNVKFPGHLGVPLGRVTGTTPSGFSVRLTEPVGIRDGILFFGDGDEPVRTGVYEMFRNGRRITDAAPGDEVTIRSVERPAVNEIVRKVSSHHTELQIRPGTWKKHAIPVPVKAVLTDTLLSFTATFPVPSAGLAREATAVRIVSVRPEPARTGRNFEALLAEILGENGEYPFRSVLASFRNESRLETEEVFIPPSVLKKSRQELYGIMDEVFRGLTARTARFLNESSKRDAALIRIDRVLEAYPSRDLLVPETDGPVPFVADPRGLTAESLPSFEGKRFLPLAPVVFDEERYFSLVADFLRSHPDTDVLVGLNNAAHLERAKELGTLPNVSFFIDYGLYCANASSYLFFRETARPAFVYFNIEGSDEEFAGLESVVAGLRETDPDNFYPPLVRTGKAFLPPLFISRICAFKHAFGESCAGCGGERRDEIRQNGRRFRLVSRDCVTYMIPSSGKS